MPRSLAIGLPRRRPATVLVTGVSLLHLLVAGRFGLRAAPVLILLFGWGTGFEESLPHWTLLGLVATAPLAVRWIAQRWEHRTVRFGVLAYSLLFAPHSQLFSPGVSFPPYRNPFSDLMGRREAAERAEALLGAGFARRLQLPAGNCSLARRIAWYARPQPVTVRRFDRFDLSLGNPREGSAGILMLPQTFRRSRQKRIRPRCAPPGRAAVDRKGVPCTGSGSITARAIAVDRG